MKINNSIGIDPDSIGCVCTFVKANESYKENRQFSISNNGMEKFIKWVKSKGESLVSIEGSNGQSKPLEDILKKNNIHFYSFSPLKVERFREGTLGAAKSNIIDAESTARLAMSLQAQGLLEKSNQSWEVDEDLRGLTRTYLRSGEQLTQEINFLWKIIKKVCNDLYLYLGGNNDEYEVTSNLIKNKGILNLFKTNPNINEWQNLNQSEIQEILGTRNRGHINALMEIGSNSRVISTSLALMLKQSAIKVVFLMEEKREIEKEISNITEDNKSVKQISNIKGIGITTAATIVAEIITTKRFANDDKLASYSGLVRILNSTGDEPKRKKTKKCIMFNKRLKNAFFNASRTYVLYNPDSHLAMYFKKLREKKMSITEARKRVARGLLRKIFKILKEVDYENDKRDDMANRIKVLISNNETTKRHIISSGIISEKEKKINKKRIST